MTEGASYCILRSRLMWATVHEQRTPCWQWVAPTISCDCLTSRQNLRTCFVSVNRWSKVLRKWCSSVSLLTHCSMYVSLMVRVSTSNSPTLCLLRPWEDCSFIASLKEEAIGFEKLPDMDSCPWAEDSILALDDPYNHLWLLAWLASGIWGHLSTLVD